MKKLDKTEKRRIAPPEKRHKNPRKRKQARHYLRGNKKLLQKLARA